MGKTELTVKDFAKLFGIKQIDIPRNCRALIASYNFKYQDVAPAKRDEIITQVLKKVDSGKLSVSGKMKKIRWEEGWKETFNDFVKSKYNLKTLVPKYMRPNQPVRLFGKYVLPVDPTFELNWFDVFRCWIFKKYFKNANMIYEFGCGTGYNVAVLAEIFSQKKIVGLDWAKGSIDIVSSLKREYGYNVEGNLFDIFAPDTNLKIENQSGVLTVDALEQIGSDFKNFLDYIIHNKPQVCVHIEPLYELYKEEKLFDYLAMKFHKKRNYLKGFLPYLQDLEVKKFIEIIAVQKVEFGSLYHDAYSYVVWRPKP